jgi:hypothetical protein
VRAVVCAVRAFFDDERRGNRRIAVTNVVKRVATACDLSESTVKRLATTPMKRLATTPMMMMQAPSPVRSRHPLGRLFRKSLWRGCARPCTA